MHVNESLSLVFASLRASHDTCRHIASSLGDYHVSCDTRALIAHAVMHSTALDKLTVCALPRPNSTVCSLIIMVALRCMQTAVVIAAYGGV
jgi:hypothetical protein